MHQILISHPSEFDLYIPQILAAVPASKLIFLHGELGAGKTTFTQRLGKYLGVTRPIVSPTFTYIREYDAKDQRKLYHLDLYRFVGNIDDIFPAPDLDQVAYICIEWPERVPELLLQPHLDITLSYHAETERNIVW
ncbi:MAG: tRNA (adenosine(37)-N6)-threonylcarbamoyltransferase complex ATPase subunit type 1 TsaE [Candidatus Abawacabacteria bacterium]|nr:tRNA (adenosine(37)-N6)-threonylcarbamoyltransferase complex ATPase subunit type 1 TsaE [Candidatus Abawacabacteria bacterium]